MSFIWQSIRSISVTGKARTSNIEKRIRDALTARVKSGKKRVKHFDGIAMKFPRADAAFKQIKQKFDEFDEDHSNSIDLDELKHCFRDLKVLVSDDEMREFFDASDMDSSNGVQFKEFILLMALVYLLKPPEEGKSRLGLPGVEAAFEMMEDAFIFFDKDGDGFITKEEIASALKSKQDGSVGKAVSQRFAEMDYDTDGRCTFREFLYAYVGWVGTAEDEDEDDE